MPLKTSVREPIPELFIAAKCLDAAADAHLIGDTKIASELFRLADMPVLRDWTESHWGANTEYKNTVMKDSSFPELPKEQRIEVRMPTKEQKNALHLRDRFHCRFCGVPVIRKEIRVELRKHYPDEIPWGRTNPEQHAAFQALWLQYDHLLPHSRGGDNSIENVAITCAPCNYVRMNNLIIEMGLSNPLDREVPESSWDGLERLLRR